MKRLRGRAIVAMTLVGFVAVAACVIWRRGYGYEQDRAIRQLSVERSQLAADKARLEGEVRDLAGRGRLAPLAERKLRMRVPSDSMQVLLTRPGS